MPPVNELLNSLLRVLGRFNEIFILLDALDEIPREYDRRKEVLEMIEKVWNRGFRGLHLLVTSRNHSDIERSFHPSQEEALEMKKQDIDRDISKFVSDQLKDDPEFQRWKDRHDEIQAKLTEYADGA